MLAGLVVFFAFAVLISTLFLLSPGKPKPFYNRNNEVLKHSISEKIFVEINGLKQGMFIKGENLDNPVILYLHGGMPDYFLTEKYPTQLEKNFTMVWWEQRGCGISQNSDSKNSNTTIEQLTDDAITLTKYLLERFNKKKLYLMGHSGGTFVGVNVIDKAPQLFYAYIGIAQMSNQRLSEKLAYDYMLKRYGELGNYGRLNKLRKIKMEDTGELPEDYVKMRDVMMHELGIGTMINMKNLFTDLILPSMLFSEYTVTEKFNLWKNKSKSGISQNWKKMENTNLIESKTSFKIPVYFLHGIYDYTCSYELAKTYFENIKAPLKGFYSFNQSAHCPLFEEPVKMNKILKDDIVNGRADLADKI